MLAAPSERLSVGGARPGPEQSWRVRSRTIRDGSPIPPRWPNRGATRMSDGASGHRAILQLERHQFDPEVD
jgi:hypothetical protein